MPSAFSSLEEERKYLEDVKKELDACATIQDVVDLWKRHYLKVGHKKLGRLLIGRSVESAMRRRKSAED